MHAHCLRKRLTAATLVAASALGATRAATADDAGLFGRLFRLGGASNSARNRPAPAPNGEKAPAGHNHDHDRDGGGDAFIPPASPRAGAANAAPAASPIGPGAGPSTPEVAETGSAPPITPRSRVSTAATDADPLLTRMALGRSNDGSQFGMFLQVYADGTVIDSEGVHRIAPADLRPIAELVASGELGKNRGHCGSPSGDYIEEVHVVVFERRLGRLTAQPFSYSGNPQGCDPSVRQLHTLIENLQARLSGQPATPTAAAHATAPAASSAPMQAPPIVAEAPAPFPVAAPAPAPASAFGGSSAGRQPRSPFPNGSGAGRVLPPLPATSPSSAAPSGPVIPLTAPDGR